MSDLTIIFSDYKNIPGLEKKFTFPNRPHGAKQNGTRPRRLTVIGDILTQQQKDWFYKDVKPRLHPTHIID